MLLRISNFVFDEKDFFLVLSGVFLGVSAFFHIPVEPFRFPSLVVLYVFLLVTRVLVSRIPLWVYTALTLSALLLSMYLSPYGLGIYLLVVIVLYTKRSL